MSFLDTFLDRSVAQPNPFNALGVLSRADEMGAGRLDAMTSATSVARRFEADPRIRSLCSGVVPVAGLLAETGVTLTEDEVAALRAVAGTATTATDIGNAVVFLASDEARFITGISVYFA